MTAANASGGGMRRVSLNPATFVAGGLIDDVDVVVNDARWCIYDYNKKADPALCLGIQFATDDGKTHDQYYSAGDMEFFRPSLPAEDGTAEGGGFLVPISTREAMSSSCNAALFLNSLIGAGYPVQVLEGNTIMAALVTMRAHINQVAQPKRTGLVKKPGQAGQPEREKTTALVSKIITFPAITGIMNTPQAGQLKPAAAPAPTPINRPAAAPAATAAPVSAVGGDTELQTLCADTLIGMLAEAGGSLAKKDIATLAFRALSAHPRKKEAIPLIFSDPFLQSVAGVRYDGATVQLG